MKTVILLISIAMIGSGLSAQTVPATTPNADRDSKYLVQAAVNAESSCSVGLPANVKAGDLVRIAVRSKSAQTPSVSPSTGDAVSSDRPVKHKYFWEQNFYSTPKKTGIFSVTVKNSDCFQIRVEEYLPSVKTQ